MTENINKEANDSQDSLVDALESIKSLLAKSDSKLAAARESIAIASNQTQAGHIDINDPSLQLEIPTLDDVVIPDELESATEEVSNISEQISEKIEETLAAVSESIPETELSAATSEPVIIEKHDPQITLDYIDTLQGSLEKTLHAAIVKSLTSLESDLKKSIASDMDKIREQITKDSK